MSRLIKKSIRVFLIFVLLSWATLIGYVFFSAKNVFKFDVHFLVPFLERVFAHNFPSLSYIQIEDAFFTWDKFDSRFGLGLIGASGVVTNTNFLLKSPKIEFVALGFADLFESLVDYLFNYFSSNNAPVVFHLDELTIVENKGIAQKLLFLRADTFVNIFSIFSSLNAAKVQLNNVYFETYKNEKRENLGSFELSMNKKYDMDILKMKLGNKQRGFVTAEFRETYRRVLSTNIGFNDVDLGFLDSFGAPIKVSDVKKINGYIHSKNGNMDNLLSVDVSLSLDGLNFECNSSKSCVLNSGYFNVNYDNGQIFSHDSYIIVDDRKLVVDTTLEKDSISLILKVSSLDNEMACKYWLYAGEARNWFCKNVKNADFSDLEIDFILPFEHDQSRKRVRFLGKSDFQKAQIELGDRFHELTDGVGSLVFLEDRLDIDIKSGKVRNINVYEGEVSITDDTGYDDNRTVLTVNTKANASLAHAYDIAEIDPKYTGVSSKSKLEGLVLADVGFIIDFFENDISSLRFLKLKGFSNDVGIENIGYDGFQISKSKLDLNIDDDKLSLNIFNKKENENFNFSIHGKYGKSIALEGNLAATFPAMDAVSIGLISEHDVRGGNFSLGIDFSLKEEKFNASIKSDIHELDFKIPIIGWQNKPEYGASLKIDIESQDEGVFLIRSLNISGKSIDVSGRGVIKHGEYVFDIPHIKIFDNDFSFKMKSTDKMVFYDIVGKSLDLSNSDLSPRDTSGADEKLIAVNVNNVLMKYGVRMKDLDIFLHCMGGNCNNSYVKSYFTNDTFFNVYMSNVGLEGYSNDAGLLLRGLGIIKDVYYGDLYFFMTNMEHDRVDGVVSMTNFRIVGAPILGTVLSMSSLDNVVGTLGGEGIAFNNVTIPFTYVTPILKIYESWMEGGALGASISGLVDLHTKKYILDGQIVPAYALNKMIWSIPLIGKILTGGKSRGIISLDYGIKGDADDYKLSVNIISVLTPSLLKEFIHILDRALSGNG